MGMLEIRVLGRNERCTACGNLISSEQTHGATSLTHCNHASHLIEKFFLFAKEEKKDRQNPRLLFSTTGGDNLTPNMIYKSNSQGEEHEENQEKTLLTFFS